MSHAINYPDLFDRLVAKAQKPDSHSHSSGGGCCSSDSKPAAKSGGGCCGGDDIHEEAPEDTLKGYLPLLNEILFETLVA